MRTVSPCESIDTHKEGTDTPVAGPPAFRTVSCEVAFEVIPLQPDRVSLGVAGQGSLKTACGWKRKVFCLAHTHSSAFSHAPSRARGACPVPLAVPGSVMQIAQSNPLQVAPHLATVPL